LVEISSATCLLVDSDSTLRKAEAALIKEMGFPNILQAAAGAEAWSMFKHFQADLVISAWDLPEMSGLVLLKVIRADTASARTPVILMVDEVTRKQVLEAGEAGVSGMILRPFTKETFVKKVEETLETEEDAETIEAKAAYDQGLELMTAGRFEEALAQFKRILTLYESAEIYYNLGYIKTAQGLYEEALLAFRRATQINSAFAQAYQKMAEVYLKLGRQDEAQRCLEKAAEIYMDKNMDENAEAVFMEAIKINPNTMNVYNSLGILYRRQGRYEDSVRQYKKALRVNPDDEHIHYNLARALLAVKDFDGAAQVLRQALQINYDFGEARELLRSIELGQSLR